MTPEQLRIHLHGPRDSRKSAARRRAIRDADNRAVEETCAKYRRSDNPFLRQMENRCDPHAPCPSPDSCNTDQICIYRCQLLPDNVGNRSRLAMQVAAGQWLADDYKRHTVDIRGPAPQYVEDGMLAVERGYSHAKWMWAAILIGVIAYVVWQVT